MVKDRLWKVVRLLVLGEDRIESFEVILVFDQRHTEDHVILNWLSGCVLNCLGSFRYLENYR